MPWTLQKNTFNRLLKNYKTAKGFCNTYPGKSLSSLIVHLKRPVIPQFGSKLRDLIRLFGLKKSNFGHFQQPVRKRLKLIACEIFARELSFAVSSSGNIVDVEFLEKGLHDKSEVLKDALQKKINVTGKPYDALIFGYGLCGNSANGLVAGEIPLILPRAHDCSAILLGSHTRFTELFGDNPSQPWTSAGYMERGDSMLREGGSTGEQQGGKSYEDYIKEYGEENAKFIMETLSPKQHSDKMVFIDMEPTTHLGYKEAAKEYAKENNLKYVEYKGDMSMLKDLVDGNWDEKRFLVVTPGKKIHAVYGDEVFKEA